MSMKITRLYTYWDPDQAHTILEFLDRLRDQIWEIYGDEIVDLLRNRSDTPTKDQHQIELEFDDDIDF